MHVSFKEQTCSEENFLYVFVQAYTETPAFRDRRTGCEDMLSPLFVDLTSKLSFVVFGIAVRDFRSPYVVRLRVRAVPTDGTRELEICYLSPTMGKSGLRGGRR